MTDERIIPTPGEQSVVSHALLVDGTELPATFEVLAVTTHREVNRIPWARILLRDGDAAAETFQLSSAPELVPGKTVEIQAGYAGQNETIFKGILTRHGIRVQDGGHSFLEVECRDTAVKMTIGRRSAYFLEMTDADVIEQILSSYGLETDVAATTATHAHLIQYDASDWDFMLSRADVNGMLVFVDDGKVTVTPPEMTGSADLTLTYGDTIHEIDAEIDARYQFSGVGASGWDFKQQQVVEAEESAADLNGVGNLKETALAGIVGPERFDFRHPGVPAEPELKAWAAAQVVRSQLAKVVGRVRFRGFAGIGPGKRLELKGLGDRFNGTAYVTGVRHELKEGSWFTVAGFGLAPDRFAEREHIMSAPAAGLLPGQYGLQIGIVTGLKDPDGEDRIQVRLPLADPESAGTWVRMATPDAGKERGFFFRPEIDDEVVVGFLQGDPRHGIILGGLHSSNKPAPLQGEDANNEKVLVTRSKMRLHFDDDKKVLTIETPGGNSAVFSDDAESITLTDKHGNTITMDSEGVTIKASKITLESDQETSVKAGSDFKAEGGSNVAVKSGASLKVEAGASGEVKSSGTLTLKGALVQIN